MPGPAPTRPVMKICSVNEWMNESIDWKGEKAIGWKISMGKFIKISSTILIFFGLMCRLLSKIRLWYFSLISGEIVFVGWFRTHLPRTFHYYWVWFTDYVHWYAYQVLGDTEASWIYLQDERKREEIICIEDTSSRHSQENCICQGSDLPYFPAISGGVESRKLTRVRRPDLCRHIWYSLVLWFWALFNLLLSMYKCLWEESFNVMISFMRVSNVFWIHFYFSTTTIWL